MSQLEKMEEIISALEYAKTTKEIIMIMNQLRNLMKDPKTTDEDNVKLLSIAAKINNKMANAQS
jgi:hypothetical protein